MQKKWVLNTVYKYIFEVTKIHKRADTYLYGMKMHTFKALIATNENTLPNYVAISRNSSQSMRSTKSWH